MFSLCFHLCIHLYFYKYFVYLQTLTKTIIVAIFKYSKFNIYLIYIPNSKALFLCLCKKETDNKTSKMYKMLMFLFLFRFILFFFTHELSRASFMLMLLVFILKRLKNRKFIFNKVDKAQNVSRVSTSLNAR